MNFRPAFLLREGYLNVRRNLSMSISSILIIAISLAIVWGFALVNHKIGSQMRHLKTRLPVVVYLEPDADANAVVEEIRSEFPKIDSIVQVSSTETFDNFKKDPELSGYLEALGFNPFPDTVDIRFSPQTCAEEMASAARIISSDIDGVDSVDFGRDLALRLEKTMNGFRLLGYGAGIFLAIASMITIYNTIRITVIAKTQFLQVLKLFGATRWFMRWPFIIEGAIFGLSGGALAMALLAFMARGLGNLLPKITPMLGLPGLGFFQIPVFLPVAAIFSGMLIGMLGAVIAVHRYVRIY